MKKSPLDLLYEAGSIKRRMFCFNLHHQNNEPVVNGQNVGGELQIGGCEHEPTIHIPLTSLGYWQFRMAGVSVDKDNRNVHHACEGGCEAIMDTGTSLITGPADEIEALNAALGFQKDANTNQYLMNCADKSKIASMPHITFTVGDGSVTLTAADYIVQVGGSVCISGFMPSPNGSAQQLWILGDVFIRTKVVIFDMDKRQLGLAPKQSSN